LTMYGVCIHYNALVKDICRHKDECKSAHWCCLDLQGDREGFELNDRVSITLEQANEHLAKKQEEERQVTEKNRLDILEKFELKRAAREDNQSTRANRSSYQAQLARGNTAMYGLMFTKFGPGELNQFDPFNEHPSAKIIKKEMMKHIYRRFCEKSDQQPSIMKEGIYGTCGGGPHPLFRRVRCEVICPRCLLKAYCCQGCMNVHSDIHVWECKLHSGYIQEYDEEHAEAKRQNTALSTALAAQVKKAEQVAKEAKAVKEAENIANADKAKHEAIEAKVFDAEITEKNVELGNKGVDITVLLEAIESMTKKFDDPNTEDPDIDISGMDDEDSANDDDRPTSPSLSVQYRNAKESKDASDVVAKALVGAKLSMQAFDARAAEAHQDGSTGAVAEAKEGPNIASAVSAADGPD